MRGFVIEQEFSTGGLPITLASGDPSTVPRFPINHWFRNPERSHNFTPQDFIEHPIRPAPAGVMGSIAEIHISSSGCLVVTSAGLIAPIQPVQHERLDKPALGVVRGNSPASGVDRLAFDARRQRFLPLPCTV